jgi:hypothetical protein
MVTTRTISRMPTLMEYFCSSKIQRKKVTAPRMGMARIWRRMLSAKWRSNQLRSAEDSDGLGWFGWDGGGGPGEGLIVHLGAAQIRAYRQIKMIENWAGDAAVSPKKDWRYEQDAGPSTASLAIRLRETPLRMTGFSIPQFLTSCQYVDTA